MHQSNAAGSLIRSNDSRGLASKCLNVGRGQTGPAGSKRVGIHQMRTGGPLGSITAMREPVPVRTLLRASDHPRIRLDWRRRRWRRLLSRMPTIANHTQIGSNRINASAPKASKNGSTKTALTPRASLLLERAGETGKSFTPLAASIRLDLVVIIADAEQ